MSSSQTLQTFSLTAERNVSAQQPLHKDSFGLVTGGASMVRAKWRYNSIISSAVAYYGSIYFDVHCCLISRMSTYVDADTRMVIIR